MLNPLKILILKIKVKKRKIFFLILKKIGLGIRSAVIIYSFVKKIVLRVMYNEASCVCAYFKCEWCCLGTTWSVSIVLVSSSRHQVLFFFLENQVVNKPQYKLLKRALNWTEMREKNRHCSVCHWNRFIRNFLYHTKADPLSACTLSLSLDQSTGKQLVCISKEMCWLRRAATSSVTLLLQLTNSIYQQVCIMFDTCS